LLIRPYAPLYAVLLQGTFLQDSNSSSTVSKAVQEQQQQQDEQQQQSSNSNSSSPGTSTEPSCSVGLRQHCDASPQLIQQHT
jgi:hypothetical protein